MPNSEFKDSLQRTAERLGVEEKDYVQEAIEFFAQRNAELGDKIIHPVHEAILPPELIHKAIHDHEMWDILCNELGWQVAIAAKQLQLIADACTLMWGHERTKVLFKGILDHSIEPIDTDAINLALLDIPDDISSITEGTN